jgi:hypothetical protein
LGSQKTLYFDLHLQGLIPAKQSLIMSIKTVSSSHLRNSNMRLFKLTHLAIAALGSLPLPLSAQVHLICENPIREYLVVYESGQPFLTLSPDTSNTRYQVIVDDNTDTSHTVIASVPDTDLTARLHLRPYLKLEFWANGEVFQTDGCYKSR